MANEIYGKIPKLIQLALDNRQDKFELYGYNRYSDRHYYTYNEDRARSLREDTIMSELERMLKKDGVKYEIKNGYYNDEGFYGSDSIGNPSYWVETDLIVKF